MLRRSSRALNSTTGVGHLLGATLAVVLAACGVGAPPSPPGVAPSGTTPSTAAPTPTERVTADVTQRPATAPPTIAPGPPTTLLIDTDVAPDDIVAITFLVRAPNVTVAGITISGTGEAHCAGGLQVVLSLLERLRAPAIPVACGRETPLRGTHAFPDAWRESADAGSGLPIVPTTRVAAPGTAVELIESLVAANHQLEILTLGPLTNLADALQADPGLAARLGPIFIMGGAFHVPGNIVGPGAPTGNSVAEWNIYVDPHGAQIVVDSGRQPHFVSLDGTNQVPLTSTFGDRVANAASRPATDVVTKLFTANPFMTAGGYYLWDPLAAELAAGYPVGTFSPTSMKIEEQEGTESGFTRPTTGPDNVLYLSAASRPDAEDSLFLVLTRA